MKKCLWTLLAVAMFLPCGILSMPDEAQAEQFQFELLGKLGGAHDGIDKISLGDPSFDVSGGLEMAAFFRFDMGIGVGLNFNWTMVSHRLGETKLTKALNAYERKMVVQHPSIGLTVRYEMFDMLDLGIWLNYGFGNTHIDYDDSRFNMNTAATYGLDNANLKWQLQTFELGIMANFVYKITKINLDVIIGLQGFVDFSRMVADDNSLENARDISNRSLDENSLYTVGFHVVFGARYDLLFGSSKRKQAMQE